MQGTLGLGTSSLGNRFVAFGCGIVDTRHKHTEKDVIYSGVINLAVRCAGTNEVMTSIWFQLQRAPLLYMCLVSVYENGCTENIAPLSSPLSDALLRFPCCSSETRPNPTGRLVRYAE